MICILVGGKRDTHQVEQINVERLVSLLLHLRYVISLLSRSCLLKTGIENIPQLAKTCMGTIHLFHLLLSLVHISLQQLHHHINCIKPGKWTIVVQERALDGKMQQIWHIIKCHCHLPHRKVVARGLLMSSLNKDRNKIVIKNTIVCIL